MTTRRSFLRKSGALLAGSTLSPALLGAGARSLCGECGSVRERQTWASLPVPTPAQRRWQDAEIGVLFHLDLPVVAGDDGSDDARRRTIDPRLYDPKELDTDQWIEAAKSAGAKYAIFTATHDSGFMQWSSGLYPYGCREAAWKGGKGDVVGDFVASCHKYGLLPGLFLTTRRNAYHRVRNHYVYSGRGTEAQAAYNRIVEAQTEELCSRYGALLQIWFDDGVRAPAQGGPDVLSIFDRHQPDSVFYHSIERSDCRWIGNVNGQAAYPCWATMPGPENGYLSHKSLSWNPFLASGHPDGTVWAPAMVDIPLRGKGRQAWSWRPDEEGNVSDLEDLMGAYYRSVGRNCNLVIGVGIDPSGLVPEPDRNRLAEFGSRLDRLFHRPIIETSGSGDRILLEVHAGARIDHLVLMEDITFGERIRRFSVEYLLPHGRWRPVEMGTSIGHKWILPMEPVPTSAIRVVVRESDAVPIVRRLSLYGAG